MRATATKISYLKNCPGGLGTRIVTGGVAVSFLTGQKSRQIDYFEWLPKFKANGFCTTASAGTTWPPKQGCGSLPGAEDGTRRHYMKRQPKLKRENERNLKASVGVDCRIN